MKRNFFELKAFDKKKMYLKMPNDVSIVIG